MVEDRVRREGIASAESEHCRLQRLQIATGNVLTGVRRSGTGALVEESIASQTRRPRRLRPSTPPPTVAFALHRNPHARQDTGVNLDFRSHSASLSSHRTGCSKPAQTTARKCNTIARLAHLNSTDILLSASSARLHPQSFDYHPSGPRLEFSAADTPWNETPERFRAIPLLSTVSS